MAKKKVENRELIEAVEIFKDKVYAVQEGIEELRSTGIKESVLILLIQKNSQKYTEMRNNNITLDDIQAILRGIETLPEFIFHAS